MPIMACDTLLTPWRVHTLSSSRVSAHTAASQQSPRKCPEFCKLAAGSSRPSVGQQQVSASCSIIHRSGALHTDQAAPAYGAAYASVRAAVSIMDAAAAGATDFPAVLDGQSLHIWLVMSRRMQSVHGSDNTDSYVSTETALCGSAEVGAAVIVRCCSALVAWTTWRLSWRTLWRQHGSHA